MEKKKYQTPQVNIYAIDLTTPVCTSGSIPVGGRVDQLDAASYRSNLWEN